MSARAFTKMLAQTYSEFERVVRADSYPPPQELLIALEKLITGSEVPIKDIAVDVAAPFIKNISPDDPSGLPDCSILWRTILEAINAFKEHNDKLVDLVLAIMQLGDGKNPIKASPEFDQHMSEFAISSKFDVFSLVFFIWLQSECVKTYGSTVRDLPSSDPHREIRRQGLVNEHAFMAKLSARGHQLGCLTHDEITRAGPVLYMTCEFAPWEEVHFPDIEGYYDEDEDEEDWKEWRDQQLELKSIRVLNVRIPAAYHWLKHEGTRIYRLQGEMNGDKYGLNGKWTGEKGYSKERFAYWGERFQWMTQVTALEKSTQRLAQECADMVQKIIEE